MCKQDVAKWNAIIPDYSQIGHLHEALIFFNEIQVLGIKPNSMMVVVEQGKNIHGYAMISTFDMMLSWVMHLQTCMPNMEISTLPTNCLKELLKDILGHAMQSLLNIPNWPFI
jgi:hypothetical protein